MLGTDELDAVMLAVWKVCSEAPRCAAVNRQFKRAAEVAEAESKVLDVAPHRPQMKVASNPSLTPSVVEDDAVITPWGESLEAFVPSERQRNPVSKDDMQRVLDVKGARGGGWLTNTAVDTYLSTLMPSLKEAEIGAPRVFLPGVHSLTLDKTGKLGFIAEDLESGEIDEVATAELRAHAAGVLAAAEEGYVNYNLSNFHWGLMRVQSKFERCEIFDSTGHTKKKHGRKLLEGYQELTGVDTSGWAVVVYESVESGMPQQEDGKSCGVFACITAAHLVSDAALPDIQADVKVWRRHIAAMIV